MHFFRSRGRGLVTKPSLDPIKSSLQEDKLKQKVGLPSISEHDIHQVRDGTERSCDTQSDKENDNDKMLTTPNVITPSTALAGSNGFGPDPNKPVKMKSLWRRSSELEMSNSSSWLAAQSNSGFLNSSLKGDAIEVASNNQNGSVNKTCSYLPAGIEQVSKLGDKFKDLLKSATTYSNNDLDPSNNTPISTSNVSNIFITAIPKTVGAKISLPMVSAEADREMEERLSQFEHLKENLYLTER